MCVVVGLLIALLMVIFGVWDINKSKQLDMSNVIRQASPDVIMTMLGSNKAFQTDVCIVYCDDYVMHATLCSGQIHRATCVLLDKYCQMVCSNNSIETTSQTMSTENDNSV